MKKEAEEIAERMKGVSQTDVADALGITEETLQSWLNGEMSDDKKKLVLLAIEKCRQDREGE